MKKDKLEDFNSLKENNKSLLYILYVADTTWEIGEASKATNSAHQPCNTTS